MATKIIKEIDSNDPKNHLKIGIIFIISLIIFFYLFKNTNHKASIPFVATFNYVEGINYNSEVQIAGVKVGDVSDITISSNRVIIKGFIDNDYNIPNDSILKIKSDGIFGRKAISIEPGFGEYLDKSKNQYIFDQTQDSYSVDMFLRYLNSLNE